MRIYIKKVEPPITDDISDGGAGLPETKNKVYLKCPTVDVL